MTIFNTLLIDARPGDKVRFAEEKQAYTIRARNERFLVCNKPFNPKRTVLYTIVDLKEEIRGPENLIFGAGAETEKQCEEMVARLEGRSLEWATDISRRRHIPLKVETLIKGPDRYCGFCNRTQEEGPCGMCKTGPAI